MTLYFFAIDLACIYFQIQIVSKIWKLKKNVSQSEIQIILAVIFLNPLSLAGISAQNVCQIRDLLSNIMISMFLDNNPNQASKIILMAISLYIDPTSWVFIVGFSILSKNVINSAIEIASTFALSAVLMFVSGNFNE